MDEQVIRDRKVLRVKISPFFKWFDLWIGLYIDTKSSAAYICFLTLGIKVEWWIETNINRSFNDGWKQAIEYCEALIKLDHDVDQSIADTKALIQR